MAFQVIYTFFIIAQLLFGSVYVGPATPRQIMAVIMFIVCIKEKSVKIDTYFFIYLFFIYGYVIAQLITGYFSELIRLLFGYYFVSYVAYQSTKLLIKKTGNADLLLTIIFIIGLLDALVTIGQMYQMPFANMINKILCPSIDDTYDTMALRNQSNMLGYTIPGLFGPVPNGYYLSAMTILGFYNKNVRLSLTNILIVSFFIFSTFIVQERTALVVAVVLSSFTLYKILRSSNEYSQLKKSFVLLSLVIIAIIVIPDLWTFMSEGESRYSRGFSLSEDRGDINIATIEFLSSNPLGGINKLQMENHYPHNLILNAFVFGGLIGGTALLVLCILQIKLCCKKAFSQITKENIQQFIIIIMFCAYTLNSFTHNLSIVTGEPTIWLFWGAIIGLEKYRVHYKKC